MREDLKLLMSYLKDFFRSKRLIYSIVGIFFICGIFITLSTPNEYQSTVGFTLQTASDESPLGSGLKNIAQVVGISLGGDDSEAKDLPVYLYPKIINSLPYQQQLWETPLKFSKIDSTITFRDYYINEGRPDALKTIKKYTIGLPSLIIRSIKKKENNNIQYIDSLNYITEEEMMLKEVLVEVLQFSVDEVDGSLLIKGRMPEAIPAAQLVESARAILQKEIIKFRIGKAQDKYDFIEKQHSAKKEEFIEAQNKLASYIDRNAYNVTQKSKIQLNRLQSEYDLQKSLFTELERQKLSQSIKIQEDTPLFSILDPAIVPLKPVNDGFLFSIIKYIIIGFICSVFIYIGRSVFLEFKTIWKES